jgi:hypothetical protein
MTQDNRQADVYSLVATLSRVGDPRQRSFALASRLKGHEIDFILDVLRVIRERALDGEEDFLRLYNGLLVNDTFGGVLGNVTMSALVEKAQERGDYEIVALLLDLPHENRDDAPPQPFLDAALRDVPLGMRKSLARSLDFNLLRKIARDQDHRVIGHLLSNPRLTEPDVISIGSTRPTSPKVLEEIFKHPKWICRYRVKKVIVLNPHSPLSLALRLLAYLTVQDLDFVCQSTELDPHLISEAVRLLERKGGGNVVEYDLPCDCDLPECE